MRYLLVILVLATWGCSKQTTGADAQHKRARSSERRPETGGGSGESAPDASGDSRPIAGAAAAGGTRSEDGGAANAADSGSLPAAGAAVASGGQSGGGGAGNGAPVQQPTRERVEARERANCRFAASTPRFARDNSWVLARCGDDLARVSLDDLSVRVLAQVRDELDDTRILSDRVLYIEAGELKSVAAHGGEPTTLASEASSILALTPDETRVVFRTLTNSLAACAISGDEPLVELVPADPFPGFAGLTADGERILYHSQPPGSYRSIAVGGGPVRDLGGGLLSDDKRWIARLDAQRVVVQAVDGSSDVAWSDVGYTPVSVLGFTRNNQGVVVEDASGDVRLFSRTGAASVHLASTDLWPPALRDPGARETVTQVASAALLRWCRGACDRDFYIVPLSGAPPQHFKFASCQFDHIDLLADYVSIDRSGDLALFSDRDGSLLMADGASLSGRTLAEGLGYLCGGEWNWSPDASMLHYRICQVGACTLTFLDREGRMLARYLNAGQPIYAPTSRHAAFVSKELHLARIGEDALLYNRTLERVVFDPVQFVWADDTTFVYEDTDVLHVLRVLRE